MIRSGAEVAGGFTERVHVCVIGSGAGGGVAAARLAEAGRDVLVLEEGSHVPKEQMTQREEEMHPLLYRDGGNQLTADGGVNVLQGRTVGGSTVVNMADVVEIPDGVLAHWAERFGVDRFSVDEVRAADAICRETIGANRIPAHNRNNSLLLAGGERLGLRGGAFDHNRVGCLGSGYCLIGCAYDAKRSVALTWLPRAIATGRTLVQTEARVDRLETQGRRVVAAVGSVIRVRDGAPVAPFRVEADSFVLAAGAVHSPVILLRSGLGGPAVGQNLSLQPQTPCAALFPDPVTMWRGVPQSAYIDHFETATAEHGLAGFRLEGVSGGPAMSAVTTTLWGPDLHEFMRGFPRTAAALCLVPDRPSGRVSVTRDGRPKIAYSLTPEVVQTLKTAVQTAARAWLAAGAEVVVLPFPGTTPARTEADLAQLDSRTIQGAEVPLISAHPQGTCRMGPDPATSVVGLDLRVHGVDNLQVLDASVFPTTSSSHTMLPVMSFAWLGAGLNA